MKQRVIKTDFFFLNCIIKRTDLFFSKSLSMSRHENDVYCRCFKSSNLLKIFFPFFSDSFCFVAIKMAALALMSDWRIARLKLFLVQKLGWNQSLSIKKLKRFSFWIFFSVLSFNTFLFPCSYFTKEDENRFFVKQNINQPFDIQNT